MRSCRSKPETGSCLGTVLGDARTPLAQEREDRGRGLAGTARKGGAKPGESSVPTAA